MRILCEVAPVQLGNGDKQCKCKVFSAVYREWRTASCVAVVVVEDAEERKLTMAVS